MKFPPLSVIIITLNAERTIGECLRHIKEQDYPSPLEVLIIDGGSEDNTLTIARKSGLPVRIIDGGYRDNMEARRAVGIGHAKNELCVSIDSDNYIIGTDWLRRMVEPLLEDEDIVATQTLRYAAPKHESALNRYFGLIGAGDPAAYYLGKDDRLSWRFTKWNLLGEVIAEKKTYLKIRFDPENYPSVGCNGLIFRKSILKKSNWGKPENYFHADVFVDIGRLGYNTFGIVKTQVFHNTAGTPLSFLKKKRSYMKLHHQTMHSKRRQLVFDPAKSHDVVRLILFVIFAFTFIEPTIEAILGYVKKRDTAWFLHPVMTFGMALLYTEATVTNVLFRKR